MAVTGVLIELNQLLVDGQVADDAAFQLNRLNKAGVALALVTQDQQADAEADVSSISADIPTLSVFGLADDAPASWQWPKPAQLLRACTENDIDIFNSWVIGTSHDLFRAASQAGLLGGIYIGDDMPAENLGLQVLNHALSLGDAPRVMIPPQGGCWHDH